MNEPAATSEALALPAAFATSKALTIPAAFATSAALDETGYPATLAGSVGVYWSILCNLR